MGTAIIQNAIQFIIPSFFYIVCNNSLDNSIWNGLYENYVTMTPKIYFKE